jgi:hypothetical protein
MPQVVQLDDPEPVSVADAAERPDQVSRLDRPACPGGEYQPGVLPGAAQDGTVGDLGLGADREYVQGQLEQRQVTAASCRLDRADPQGALDAQDLLPDADLIVVLVNVTPPQAEDLPAAEPVKQQEHECLPRFGRR